MNKRSVFVTGGTGLIGSHLLLNLVKSGENIRALRRESSQLDAVKKVFAHYGLESLFSKVDWIVGDITDVVSLEEALNGVTHVYHAAALVSFDPKQKKQLYQINIKGTENVVNACINKKITKLCYVSSTAAIGKSKEGVIVTEKNKWDEEEVTSNYAISKHYAENEVWRGIAEGLPAVMVNPCVIIGPGDVTRSSGTLFGTLKNGLRFYTSGSNAFVDVRDVADAMIMLMESPLEEERFLLIGENLTYKSLFEKIAKSLGVKPPTILVKGFLVDLAWRVEKIKSFITRKAPMVTSESAKSAVSNTSFSNQKMIDATGFSFRSIDEATQNTGSFYK
ncbi:MAG: dihydroflavonol-4-reductase [Salibacteraceae bacterium]|jgi:nucleoside-diphosphate-sugar epimerase